MAEDKHECVFVEEQEPSGRLILPPCIVCGCTAMDALDQLRTELANAARVEPLIALLTKRRVAALRIIGTRGQRRHPETRMWITALATELDALIPSDLRPDDDGWARRYFRALGQRAALEEECDRG